MKYVVTVLRAYRVEQEVQLEVETDSKEAADAMALSIAKSDNDLSWEDLDEELICSPRVMYTCVKPEENSNKETA